MPQWSTTSTQQIICHSVKTGSSESTKIAMQGCTGKLRSFEDFFKLFSSTGSEKIFEVFPCKLCSLPEFMIQQLQPKGKQDQIPGLHCPLPLSNLNHKGSGSEQQTRRDLHSGFEVKMQLNVRSNAPGSKCAGLTFKIKFDYLFV